jgi:hypothetical protein
MTFTGCYSITYMFLHDAAASRASISDVTNSDCHHNLHVFYFYAAYHGNITNVNITNSNQNSYLFSPIESQYLIFTNVLLFKCASTNSDALIHNYIKYSTQYIIFNNLFVSRCNDNNNNIIIIYIYDSSYIAFNNSTISECNDNTSMVIWDIIRIIWY